MIIYAGTKGYLDKVDRKNVSAWEQQFLQFMREQRPEVRGALVKEKKMTPETEKQLVDAIVAFQPQFQVPTDGRV
jgi:F-type H+-transporting ATPase subunit alpha